MCVNYGDGYETYDLPGELIDMSIDLEPEISEEIKSMWTDEAETKGIELLRSININIDKIEPIAY